MNPIRPEAHKFARILREPDDARFPLCCVAQNIVLILPLINAAQAVWLSDGVALDKANGELRVLGSRHAAIDAEAFCKHLDELTGVRVAEVIMDNHESRLGRDDAAKLRKERPQATLQEIVNHLAEAEPLSGVGVTSVTLSQASVSNIDLEISNPVVRGTEGAAKSFMFSYWCGALSFLVGKDLETKKATYDETKNLLKGTIGPRGSKWPLTKSD